MKTIDIHSKGEYPSNALSNFYAHEFYLDGVRCASMEGFLQSLKYRSAKKQAKVCALVGKTAKNAGKRKFMWKLTHKLHWQGKSFSRFGDEYAELLRRAYAELYKNPNFAAALKAAEGCTLTHSIGKTDKRKTVLTVQEFLCCIDELR